MGYGTTRKTLLHKRFDICVADPPYPIRWGFATAETNVNRAIAALEQAMACIADAQGAQFFLPEEGLAYA